MTNSPSQIWENGVLVERAVDTNEPGEPVEDDEFVSGTKPYKTPVATKRIGEAENKAVASAETKNK